MGKKKFVPVELYTAEGEGLCGMPWGEYPRPSLVRDSFFCLNGEWELTDTFGGVCKIKVPFPPESLLSGVNRRMGEHPRLTYKRSFALPEGFARGRVILHFGAVDQIAHVWLNGQKLGDHVDGYEGFSFDVTELLCPENSLEVVAENAADPLSLPYGKQCEKRGGMWYTPISGIWQTVWLESVPDIYVRSLSYKVDGTSVELTAEGVSDGEVTVRTPQGELTAKLSGGRAVIELGGVRFWSPEDPYLYRYTVVSGEDRVESYFAVRTVSCEKVGGVSRICLNGCPYFLHGLLDQGYFSDGIFTPASPECFENDILTAKELGFNMLRKHIKIEPELFYYYCDLHGMTVVQDMVNNGKYAFFRDTALPTVGFRRKNDRRLHRDAAHREAFIKGMESTVRALKNHPCIVGWTVFNEGWGQFCSAENYRRLRELDSTRFIDAASGWFYPSESDVESPHIYFKPVKLKKGGDRPVFLSEFGGYSYKPEGHVYNTVETYGYRYFEDRGEFERALVGLYRNEILTAIGAGLCGAVYTQLSDVEDETNGLISYDRRVVKVDSEVMRGVAKEIFGAFECALAENK